jgi:hypothetical protein
LLFSFNQLFFGILKNLLLSWLTNGWWWSWSLGWRLLLVAITISTNDNSNIWLEVGSTSCDYTIWWSTDSVCWNVGSCGTCWCSSGRISSVGLSCLSGCGSSGCSSC